MLDAHAQWVPHRPPAPILAFKTICSFRDKAPGGVPVTPGAHRLGCDGGPSECGNAFPVLRRLLILAGWPGKGTVPWKMPVGAHLCPLRRFGGREHLDGAGGGEGLPSAPDSSGGGEAWV